MVFRVVCAIAAVFFATSAQPAPAAPDSNEALTREAEALLGAGPFSVMDKTFTAPSGDKHDFFSLSPYHWPNPDTPDGLPYVFRDGEVNPESRGPEYDREAYYAMTNAVETLARAYRHTNDERFAERAALLMRAWFISPDTRMTPHLEYAQYVRGAEEQVPWGIIRGRRLITLAEAVEWLAPSKHWTQDDAAAWRAWLRDYVQWLITSKKGREEADAVNNHGTWYDVQVASLALASGEEAPAKQVLSRAGENRIKRQIGPTGRQNFEMFRTKSWDYSVMNLEGMFELARLAENVGIDLWNYKSEDGRSIRAALEYLIPAATGQKKWTGTQIVPFRPEKLCPLLRQAAVAYNSPQYAQAAEKIDNNRPRISEIP